MEGKNTEIMIAQENRKEAEEVMDFMGTMNQRERERFLDFLQGAKVMKSIMLDGTTMMA